MSALKERIFGRLEEIFFLLTLKAPITTAADDILKYFFKFSKKTSLDISCESFVWQTIHIKCQELFSLKKKKKKKKFKETICCRLRRQFA